MEEKKKIIIFGDNRYSNKTLSLFLMSKDFLVRICETKLQLDEVLRKEDYHLVLISSLLQDIQIEDVILEIRQYAANISIVCMCAKAADQQLLIKYQLSDLYFIIKPFSIDELFNKIQEAFNKLLQKRNTLAIFTIGILIFDANKQLLIGKKKKQIKLTPKESELLRFLCEKKESIVDRTAILEKIWKNKKTANARTIDVYINKLRKYLNEDNHVIIENIYGVGYRLSVKHEV